MIEIGLDSIWLISGWLVFLVIVYIYVPILLHPMPYLQREATRYPEPHNWPLISVIVPARDEAADIEKCLKGLLDSDYPALQVIAVNDRSQDQTGELMEAMARQDKRLKVLHIHELPEGWLGKNYAIQQGVAASTGSYLLFTDGDVFYQRDTLRQVMKVVCALELDHFCLFPDFIPGDYLENLFILHFGILFFAEFQLARLKHDPKIYTGIGAFNLVRRAPYEAAGGHQPLRLEVIDDVMLGKLMRQTGGKVGALMGGSSLRLRWHQGISGLNKGLEKNAFAAMRYQMWRYFAIVLLSLGVYVWPYLMVLALRDWSASGFAAALICLHIFYIYWGRRWGHGWHLSLGIPIAALLGVYVFGRSVYKTLQQKGIYWRDTFYDLETLKAHKF